MSVIMAPSIRKKIELASRRLRYIRAVAEAIGTESLDMLKEAQKRSDEDRIEDLRKGMKGF